MTQTTATSTKFAPRDTEEFLTEALGHLPFTTRIIEDNLLVVSTEDYDTWERLRSCQKTHPGYSFRLILSARP